MKAGAGKSEIVLAEEYLEIEDFAVIHRTLNARAVVIESGQTVVLLSLEVTSLPDKETLAIRQKIAKKYPVKESNIWVCVTHTFSIKRKRENCPESKIQGRTDQCLPGSCRKRLCRSSECFHWLW